MYWTKKKRIRNRRMRRKALRRELMRILSRSSNRFDFGAGLRIVTRESRPGSRCLCQQWRRWRKVRAPADRVPGNAWGARAHGKCNREQTAQVPHGTGKGETVR